MLNQYWNSAWWMLLHKRWRIQRKAELFYWGRDVRKLSNKRWFMSWFWKDEELLNHRDLASTWRMARSHWRANRRDARVSFTFIPSFPSKMSQKIPRQTLWCKLLVFRELTKSEFFLVEFSGMNLLVLNSLCFFCCCCCCFLFTVGTRRKLFKMSPCQEPNQSYDENSMLY